MLQLQQVTKRFGGLQVIQNLTFRVSEEEIVSVIGPNGAGKSTLLNLMTGLYPPDSGTILLNGRSLVGLKPHQITQLGIARTFQNLRLFLNLSVIENVMSAAYAHTQANVLQIATRSKVFRHEEERIRANAEHILEFFGQRLTAYRLDQPAYSLSYANRRRLEIARALMTSPRLLLLDEPAAGMNPHESSEIADTIRAIHRSFRCAILLVEHDMRVVERVSDRVIVLDHGEKIAAGSYQSITADAQVIEAYLGKRRES